MGTILAVDLGGSGSRGRVIEDDGARRETTGERLRVSADGLVLAPQVAALARSLGVARGEAAAVCVGSSGLLTLTAGPDAVVDQLRDAIGEVPLVVASDAVTSTVGALGGRPGAVVLTGTGSTALGTDLGECWRKVDGWGHLLGDAGSGSWIGMRALTIALEQHDGRRHDAAGLLEATRRRFGDPDDWPRQLYTREDRAGVLASVVRDVAALAPEDGVCRDLLAAAGRELARSLLAALRPPVPALASWTGGIFRADGVLDMLRETVQAARPDVALIPPAGAALDGAELLARRALAGDLTPAPPLLTLP